MTTNLGTLERVDLRDVWAREAQDFTPWLAQENNLNALASVLGFDLELEVQEQNVGPFRADILCKNTDDDAWVLIENQLECTDHIHLGQLLTYAAGLHAVVIVWVAATFTDEHRAALDWLNEVTDDTIPKFNVVSKPNDWSRSVSQAAKKIANEPLTETKASQLQYWISLREHLIAAGSSVRSQKPLPQHWANFRVGRSGFGIAALLNSRENRVGVKFNMNDDKAKSYYALLFEQKQKIEEELGFSLEWLELPKKKSSSLVVYWNGKNPLDRDKWPEYHQWMQDKLEKIDAVFRPRIRVLNAGEWPPVDDDEVGE